MSSCHCVDVAMGSYDNQVSMLAPFDLEHRGDRWVCIDTCIATEIGRLWHLGVKTLNSCCGHQEVDPSVIVAPESHDLMDRLGYRWVPAPSGLRSYALTAARDAPTPDIDRRLATYLVKACIESKTEYDRGRENA